MLADGGWSRPVRVESVPSARCRVTTSSGPQMQVPQCKRQVVAPPIMQMIPCRRKRRMHVQMTFGIPHPYRASPAWRNVGDILMRYGGHRAGRRPNRWEKIDT
ncbi:hypothetical protein Cci01nite_13760 [Catellatospora citrea]|uniref:Uncharacterized protein n=1 Tax=Catellatospora citrea TaxID=53366 RepID=A0A8J3NXF7_9ACTN|nr:hypothetical protein Cci01nite_13760 [Catellatospora citrea]